MKIREINLQHLTFTVSRIAFGLMWLEGAGWKNPPFFGLYTGKDLFFWVQQAIKYPVFEPYIWFVKFVVLPNFLLFGWMVFIIEILLGVGFILGIKIRLLGLLALFHITNITLSVLRAPHEWYWTYLMMYIISCLLITYDFRKSKFSLEYWITKSFKKRTIPKF